MLESNFMEQRETSNPVLSVHGLQKRIRRKQIVTDVTFSISPGEIFGFLGPNGAGKTTTIRMLVGLIRPTAGQIMINGWDMQRDPLKAMQNVGCIVENPDLYPYLTGYENLHQLAVMQGPEAVERIGEVTELVHLTHRIHEKVRTYSLGMKQRLGIAQALLSNPKLLILDEPTNGLDPAGIRELRTFLRELAHRGMAIFISSHLLAEIELLCDSVAMIRDGAVVRSGRLEELVSELPTEVVWQVADVGLAMRVLEPFVAKADARRDHGAEGGDHRAGQDREEDQDRQGAGYGDAAHSDGPEGTLRCTMTPEEVADAVQGLAAVGCRVYEIQRNKSTLEDVFLSATGGDAP